MNNVYYPKPNSIEYPQIKVFVPYSNLRSQTAISLIGYDYHPVETAKDDDFSYSKYFKQRWEAKETFINIEHDVVVWPGAIEAIWNCEREWCVYHGHLPNHRTEPNLENAVNGIPMLCMKIAKELIEKTPGLWDEPIIWYECEKRMISCGVKPHQHFPGVVNTNPALLGFAYTDKEVI